jgi:hypothetical protein
MTEIEALNNIAKSIDHLSVAVEGLVTVLFFMLLFKDMNGNGK